MKFYSSKGYIIVALISFLIIMAIISFSDKAYIVTVILIATLSYLVWMWYDTYYMIDGDKLFYKSALLKGSINISTIVEIVKNKTQFSGIKPSLSTKGIIIKYNKWDDIYISPIDIDRFIGALKNVNPSIKTIE
ncbi:PH (Pleckstrin Homology) domain-containing protein [Mucilaginibacter gracilis]|uniref:PH (Pleckstrin Homology) domain-containing protein n=2 Tax=Mucilaginibacter gracilis TaxID=423350 RepID=A0A495J6P9_9SPHI|nr:PH (Pleckstrin Homology) domain-containing protein [Mucilaginibacter gracilis]